MRSRESLVASRPIVHPGDEVGNAHPGVTVPAMGGGESEQVEHPHGKFIG